MAAMLGSAACWGGATVMTKGALAAFDPFFLLVIQLGASVCALWLGVALTVARFPAKRQIAVAGLTGVFEPGLAYAVGVPGLVILSLIALLPAERAA
jgi:drug/metabolite transporter (DMT)-like permease